MTATVKRKSRDQQTVIVGITDTRLLGPNPRRHSLLLIPPPVGAANRYTVSFANPAVLDQGINLSPGSLPFLLDHDNFG